MSCYVACFFSNFLSNLYGNDDTAKRLRLHLSGLRTLGGFPTILDKGDKCCDFLFAFLYIKPILKSDLIQKERICSPSSVKRGNIVLAELPPMKVYPFPLLKTQGSMVHFIMVISYEINKKSLRRIS